MSTRPLVMTLLVRNEEDILYENLLYHLNSGVDHIIVIDNLSSDSSAEIVNGFVKQGVATYLFESDDTYSQAKWVTQMARRAATVLGAGWVINSDADEFWLPESGNLRDYFSQIPFYKNVVRAPRHDFVNAAQETDKFWQRMVYRKTRSINPHGHPLLPKVAHRASSRVEVDVGNHLVRRLGIQISATDGLEILHFPLRSREQYIRKIELGVKAVLSNSELDKSVCETWRTQWDELNEHGSLKFVEENTLSESEIRGQLESGQLVRDERLLQILEKLSPQ